MTNENLKRTLDPDELLAEAADKAALEPLCGWDTRRQMTLEEFVAGKIRIEHGYQLMSAPDVDAILVYGNAKGEGGIIEEVVPSPLAQSGWYRMSAYREGHLVRADRLHELEAHLFRILAANGGMFYEERE